LIVVQHGVLKKFAFKLFQNPIIAIAFILQNADLYCVSIRTAGCNGLGLADVPALAFRQPKFIANVQ